ncbi:MAG: hypothetical protein LC667_03565 [Thioalkalivibrio sp.]|nr:hypothetical protein [Thioalkalivibrio sp.]
MDRRRRVDEPATADGGRRGQGLAQLKATAFQTETHRRGEGVGHRGQQPIDIVEAGVRKKLPALTDAVLQGFPTEFRQRCNLGPDDPALSVLPFQ